jgi:hypothetical protein
MSADGAGTDYACSDCGVRQAGAGDCGSCGNGPVLDLRNSNVPARLIEQDLQLKLARQNRQRILSVGVALGYMMALDMAWPYRRRFPYLGK